MKFMKTEFKHVLSYENADKNYGSGKGIHMTVRGDDFDETFERLEKKRSKMETLMTEKVGSFVRIKTFTEETVLYNDASHKYTDEAGNALLSASQYAKQIKPPFPKDLILPKVAKKYGVPEDKIDSMWSDNGKVSRTFGDAIHFAMEQWFKYRNCSCEEKEYNLPKHPFLRGVVTSFPDKDKVIIPELVVSDVKRKMVGRIDGLMEDMTPIDYKSDADIQKNLKYHFMQLSFYATMLKNHGHKVKKVIVWNYTTKWTKHESKVLNIKSKV